MPLTVTSIASGSSGNATIIQSERSRLLIDAGIGPRSLLSALRQYGMAPGDLNAVAVTHEHVDHVRGLPPLTRLGVPVVTSRGTAAAAGIRGTTLHTIEHGREVTVGDISITALGISHDAAEPVAYAFRHADACVVLLTDLGKSEAHHVAPLTEADLVIVEANHDAEMLRRGPYPPLVKRRVASDLGHLENTAAGDLLIAAFRQRAILPTIWLGHLSETNNRPRLAVQVTTAALRTIGKTAPIVALERRKPGPTWSSDVQRRTPVQSALPLPIV